MKNIILKSIEGGYTGDEYGGEYTMEDYLHSKYQVVCDPLFWQALGKACGWNKLITSYPYLFIGENKAINYYGDKIGSTTQYGYKESPCEMWLFFASMFHEINLTQGFNEAVRWLGGLVTTTEIN